MFSLENLQLQSNTTIKINFNGGKVSSDAGLVLLHAFIDKLRLNQLLEFCFKTSGKAKRQHLDDEIFLNIKG